MSARLGPLPNFLILGAMKAGTTSLFNYVCQHPDVCGCREKEPNYLASAHQVDPAGSSALAWSVDWRQPRDLTGYQRLFAHWRGERAIGEASQSSLDSPHAPVLAADLLPQVRLVAVIRQPADRAFSHYQQNQRRGREPLDFRAALAAETARCVDASHVLYAYRDRGRYAKHLRTWLRRFPRERLLVLLYEDLADDSAAVTRKVYDFLGLDSSFQPDTSIRFNVSGDARHAVVGWAFEQFRAPRRFLERHLPATLVSGLGRALRKPAVFDADLRAEITAEMRDDILDLQDLLGRDLGAWLGAGR